MRAYIVGAGAMCAVKGEALRARAAGAARAWTALMPAPVTAIHMRRARRRVRGSRILYMPGHGFWKARRRILGGAGRGYWKGKRRKLESEKVTNFVSVECMAARSEATGGSVPVFLVVQAAFVVDGRCGGTCGVGRRSYRSAGSGRSRAAWRMWRMTSSLSETV